MISIPAFPGANVPVVVLRTKLQQVADELRGGDAFAHLCVDEQAVQEEHAALCSLVDRLAPGESTVGDLTHKCAIEENRLRARIVHVEERYPWLVSGALGGGLAALTGLAYVNLTYGAWRLGGAIGLVAGGAAAAYCAWSLGRGESMEEQRNELSQQRCALRRWAEKLDAPAYTPTSDSACATDGASPPSCHDLSSTEKKELISRLRLEINEAEQKAEARIEQNGFFVNIGGLKIAVNHPAGKEG